MCTSVCKRIPHTSEIHLYLVNSCVEVANSCVYHLRHVCVRTSLRLDTPLTYTCMYPLVCTHMYVPTCMYPLVCIHSMRRSHLKYFWISRFDGFPAYSLEWLGLRLLTWNPVRKFGVSRENVFDIYGDSCENLLEILAVVINLCPISSVWDVYISSYVLSRYIIKTNSDTQQKAFPEL